MDEKRPEVRTAGKPDLQALRQCLGELLRDPRRRYHVVDVAVSGSRARAAAGPGSDLDLLVTFDDEASLFDSYLRMAS